MTGQYSIQSKLCRLRKAYRFMYFHNLHRRASQNGPVSPIKNITYTSRCDRLNEEHRGSVGDSGSNETPLTNTLLESTPNEFKDATETPFLRLAGAGKISATVLSRWLSQDRLYAETYICFISSLIPKVTLPYEYVPDKSKSLRWRIINMLTGALNNIHTEIEFFSSTAKKYGLELQIPADASTEVFAPTSATQQYMDLFRSFSDPSSSLLEGLVVLWATEKCYLSAWTYASQNGGSGSPDDADGGALRQSFIPNWTSTEFVKFVDEIADITNALAARKKATRKLEMYKALWLHILDIEHRFWPSISEEEGNH